MSSRSLIPNYLEKFNCIGQGCEDNCCYGWEIVVDKDTFYKYRNIKNSELKDKLKKYINRNRSNSSFETYGKIKKDKDNKCSFLEDGLCEIHKEMGSDYLCITCSVYPKVFNIVDEVNEISASVSCPEIARIALLNPNKMEFNVVDQYEITRKSLFKVINSKDIDKSNSVTKYFWDLRILSISILQNRQFMLWERLILLGMFCSAIDKDIISNNIENIPSTISIYENIIKDNSIKTEMEKIPSKQIVQINCINKINEFRLNAGVEANSQSYLKCMEEFLIGLQINKDSVIEEIVERYSEAYEVYYKPYFIEREYILENYVVNYMFKNLFPLGSNEKVFDDYCKLIINYSLIKAILIGMSAYHKKLEDDMIIKLMYSFSRTIEHTNFIEELFLEFKQQDFNTMAFMSVFVKN